MAVQARACHVSSHAMPCAHAPATSLQIGGSDQWGNITAGTDLIRRVQARDGAFGAYAMDGMRA